MTLDDFRRLVRVPRAVGSAALAVAGVLALLLINNVRSAAGSMDANPGASFWDLFWSTTGEGGGTSVVLIALVWGPVVLLPVILVLTAVDVAMHPARQQRVYAQYLQDGWVAEQVPTGLKVKVGRAVHELVVLAGPGLPAEQLAQPVAQVHSRVESLDKKARRAWDAAAAGHAEAGFAVGDLMPELPAGALACTRRGKGPRVTVVSPAGGADRLQILPMADGPVPVGA